MEDIHELMMAIISLKDTVVKHISPFIHDPYPRHKIKVRGFLVAYLVLYYDKEVCR